MGPLGNDDPKRRKIVLERLKKPPASMGVGDVCWVIKETTRQALQVLFMISFAKRVFFVQLDPLPCNLVDFCEVHYLNIVFFFKRP